MNLSKFKIFLTILVSFLILVNCGKSVEKTTLMVRSGAEADALKAIAKMYNEKFNKNVVVNEVGRDGYTASMSTKLLGGTKDIDIFFVPSTMIAELAESGSLEKLDNYGETNDPDFLVTCKYKGSTYALPIDISVMLLFYRNDLIEKIPETWDEYIETAKKFSSKLNPGSPTKYGAAIGFMAAEDLSKTFFAMTWSYGGYIEKDGNLLLNSPGSITAANYYLKFIDSGVTTPDYLSWGVIQIFEALSKGELAMAAPQWNALYPYIKAGNSPFKDKIEVALIPGIRNEKGEIVRKTFTHSWTLVINSKSEGKKEAFDFISYVTGKEGARFYSMNSIGTPAKKSILTDAEVVKKRPEFKFIAESLQFAQTEPDLLKYEEFINIVNSSLTRVLTKETSSEEALKQATERFKKL